MAESFLWGVATSSHQIEGGNQWNDWWAWESQGHIEGGARSGAATDHLNRWKEDLKLAADLGLNSYRFSIEWSRIEPRQGQFSREATEWYRELIRECVRLGMTPMVTLHHFTSPLWFSELGGFSNPDSVRFFSDYVKWIAVHLGSEVKLWCTINEPVVLVLGSYLLGIMPPAVFAPDLASKAFTHLLRCHASAYQILKRELGSDVQVGFAHNLLYFKPDRVWSVMDRIVSMALWRIYNQAWLRGATGKRPRIGLWGVMPACEWPEELRGKVHTDFIGVNYYTKAYVRWRPKDAGDGRSKNLPIGISFARRTEPQSDLGWAFYPKGLGRIIRWTARYGLPIYITENGLADHADQWRSAYIESHLTQVAEARASGNDVRGYYHWSLLDNFEWIKGFGPRFGLYQVDYETFTRKMRLSSETLREWIKKG